MRYFEDFHAGQVYELGSTRMTREEILAFAEQFDPQPFHVDEEAAAASPFGGLIASGWHTSAVFMRLYVDAVLADAASLGSPGLEELRWLHPVRPDDVLTGRFTIEDTTPSGHDPHRGTVHFRSEMTNQQGVVVLRMRGRGLFARRPGDVAPAA